MLGNGNKENRQPKELSINGRKRSQSTSVYDDSYEQEIQSEKLHSDYLDDSSASDAILVDLTEPGSASELQPPMISDNLQNIMKDLKGIDFSAMPKDVSTLNPGVTANVQSLMENSKGIGISTKMKSKRPIPVLMPIVPVFKRDKKVMIAKGDVVKIILNRVDSKVDDALERLHYSGASESD